MKTEVKMENLEFHHISWTTDDQSHIPAIHFTVFYPPQPTLPYDSQVNLLSNVCQFKQQTSPLKVTSDVANSH